VISDDGNWHITRHVAASLEMPALISWNRAVPLTAGSALLWLYPHRCGYAFWEQRSREWLCNVKEHSARLWTCHRGSRTFPADIFQQAGVEDVLHALMTSRIACTTESGASRAISWPDSATTV
jgi:hypothetical protein